ncbi:MAG TPA: hypothetical protein VF736_20015 [Pyrinomonadaceae bacterium]|jgi:hypothetical protein
MATKSGSSKKGSTKKSASKKSSKKAAKKPAARAGIVAGPILPPPVNFRCIMACINKYNQCLAKGVDRALCQKRLIRCLQGCLPFASIEEGPDEG